MVLNLYRGEKKDMSMDNLQLDFPEFDPISFTDVQYDDSGQNAEVMFNW